MRNCLYICQSSDFRDFWEISGALEFGNVDSNTLTSQRAALTVHKVVREFYKINNINGKKYHKNWQNLV